MIELAMCYAIKHSVGASGKNDPADVNIVQKLLAANGFPSPPVVPAPSGPQSSASMSLENLALIDAIKKFQAGFMLFPDGKVDPNGTTFEQLQGLGLVEMSVDGGLGWYRYEVGDPNKSRIMHFGTANTVRAVCEVASAVADGMPSRGFAIGIGDLSTAMGTNLGRHQTHKHGTNVDVRPIRTDCARSPITINDAKYSREYTLLLVDSFLAHVNVKNILFNDPQIINARKPRVSASPGHDNHLHVIMKS